MRLASGHVCLVVGKGTINVQTPSREIKLIDEVPYVPSSCISFLLIRSIVSQGNLIILDDKGFVNKLTLVGTRDVRTQSARVQPARARA